MSRYTAIATRDEGWWTVEVKEVPGFFTMAKRLSQIPDLVREGLQLFPEFEEDPENAEVEVQTTGELASISQQAKTARAHAEEAQQEASQKLANAAAELYSRGLPYRDIGELLGVSFQRAQKLAVGK